jgi:DNA-binding Lrp family transcriptional regulator
MRTKAYILIETAVGKNRVVAEAVQKIDGTVQVDMVTGPYDIIAVVESEDLNSVGDLVTGHVHTINGVLRTVTCLAIGRA